MMMESNAPPMPSFMRALCMGDIERELLFPYPELAADQAETLRDVIGAVDQMLDPHAEHFRGWDVAGELPPEFVQELREFGMFGLIIPDEHGGIGFGSASYSRTLQAIARHDASVAVTVGAHSSIGMRGLLLFGTPEQKQRYLPDLATGKRIAAFCLTEPGSGSDAASVRTKAVRDGDDWVLDGEKIWITNGGIGSFFTVFARTDLDSERGHMSAFIVTPEMGGVEISPHEDKMGLRASSTTTVRFDSVRVPADHMLGQEGKGFKVAMHILNSGRTGLGGGSVGAMKQLLALATEHARERKQFGRPIAEFGLIKQKLGQMMIDCYTAESTVNMVAHQADGGVQDYSVEAAISKVLATESLWRTADEALQTAGGLGFMREMPYERIMRDCRINRIFEGTNDVLRLFIALTAMNDVGSQLKELSSGLGNAFTDPIKGFGVLSEYALRQAGIRTGIAQQKGRLEVPEPLADCARLFETQTRGLATATDRLLRKHGKKIIDKQLATRRLADIMIDLFSFACVLSRVSTAIESDGDAAHKREIEIARALGAQCDLRIRTNLSRIDDNEDELVKTLADFAVDSEGYPFDVI